MSKFEKLKHAYKDSPHFMQNSVRKKKKKKKVSYEVRTNATCLGNRIIMRNIYITGPLSSLDKKDQL